MSSLRFLKRATLREARNLSIPVEHHGQLVGRLVPIGGWVLHDLNLISQISDWRARAMQYFLTKFESTPEKTKEYLRERAIGDGDYILFVIEVEGEFLGHVGLARTSQTTAELDNLIRGVSGGIPELVGASERALALWALRKLELAQLHVRILSHNFLARALHEQVGFRILERIPLREEKAPNITRLVECSDKEANVTFTCDVMVLDRTTLLGDVSRGANTN